MSDVETKKLLECERCSSYFYRGFRSLEFRVGHILAVNRKGGIQEKDKTIKGSKMVQAFIIIRVFLTTKSKTWSVQEHVVSLQTTYLLDDLFKKEMCPF